VILRTIGRPAARFLDPMPKGAKPAPYRGFIEPCQSTLRNTPPNGAEWLHEIKYDGYRIQGMSEHRVHSSSHDAAMIGLAALARW